MIPNRIFIAVFGTTLIGLAVYHATQTPFHLGAVLFPAFIGLWLVNLAVGLGRRKHGGMCGGSHHRRGPVEGGNA